MTFPDPSRRADPTPSSRQDDDGTVPEHLLHAAELEASGRASQDALVYELLGEAGFAGEAWKEFSARLAGQALPVIRTWIGNEKIYIHVAKLGLVLHRATEHCDLLREDRDLRDELARMTVATALAKLQADWHRGEGWKPNHGASLRTWFINACLYAFASEFRRFRKDHPLSAGLLVHLDAPDTTADHVLASATRTAEAEERATVEDRLAVALAHLHPTDQAIVRAKIWRESDREIAERLDMEVRAVGRRWSRLLVKHPALRGFARGRGRP